MPNSLFLTHYYLYTNYFPGIGSNGKGYPKILLKGLKISCNESNSANNDIFSIS